MTKTHKLVIGVPAAAITIVCGLGWYGSTQSERAFQEDLSKLRTMGVATSARELLEKDTGDPATGEQYRDLITQFETLGPDASQNLKSFFAWDNTTPTSDLAKYRAYFQNLYPAIEEVSARDSISFERDWSQNYALTFPEYAGMRSLAQVMSAEGRLRAAEHDLDGTITAIETLDGLAFHTSSEPTIIAGLIGSTIQTMGLSVKSAALQAFQDDPAALDKLAACFDRHREAISYRERLSGEVVAGVEFFQSNESVKVLTGITEGEPKSAMEYVGDLPFVKAGTKRKLVGAWKEAFASMPEDPNDYEGITVAVENVAAKLEKDKSLTGQFCNIFFPVFSQVGKSLKGAAASQSVAKLGAEILKDYARLGKYPKDLSAYGELAVDPCTGKQLIYKPRAGGFTLYSVGADGTDHGGVKGKGRYQDLVVEINNKK